jgi:hypothetical protein
MANLVPLFSTPCCWCPAAKTPTNTLCTELLHQPRTIELGDTARELALTRSKVYRSKHGQHASAPTEVSAIYVPQASPQQGVITHKQLRDRDALQNMEHQTGKRENVKPQLHAHLTRNSMPVYHECIVPSVLQSWSMPLCSHRQHPCLDSLASSCRRTLT